MISPSGKTPRILIVANDEALQLQLKTALEAERMAVYKATDSDSCQATFTRVQPDLLLVDSRMVAAIEQCRAVKAASELAHIRVILIIPAETDEDLAVFERSQADEYVTLPLRMAIVLRRVGALLRGQDLEADIEFRSAIMAQMGDAVVAVDANSTVIYWNAEAERAYGLRSEAIIGRPLDDAYRIIWGPEAERDDVMASIAARGWWRGEGIHILRTGEQREVEVAVRQLVNKGNQGAGFVSVIHDLTEHKRIEAALREQRELADALRDTAAALTRSLDPETVMRLILENLGRVVPNRTANIMLIDGDRVRVGFSRGYTPEEQVAIDGIEFSPYEIPTFQDMLTNGRPHLIADTQTSPGWIRLGELRWVRSYLGMPIRAYDHVVGFLNIDADVPNAFTSVHAERLQAFADQAAIAVENAQLYEAIYRDAVEMRALHRATTFLYATNLFTSENLVEVCEHVVRVVVDEFGKLDCGILLIDDDNQSLERIARAGEFQVSAEGILYVDGPGLVPEAIRSGRTIYSQDVEQDHRYIPSNSTTKSELVIPLRTAKGTLGVLDLQSAQPDSFEEHDIRLMELFAERASAAIENVKLYNEIRHYTEELELRVQERTSELNRVKDRAEAILNHSSDAILLIRSTGVIQQTNRAFNAMFASQPDEAFGKPLTFLAEANYQSALTEALDRLVETQESERLEIVAQRKNGFVFDADVMLSPISQTEGLVESVVCSLRDITSRKRLEVELREALQKERDLSELKSRFIARASHEFRTPLAVIHTSSDLLKAYGERMSQEQRKEKLERLQTEVQRITLMLDDLLSISKGEEVKEFNPVSTDLQDLTRTTVQEISEGIGTTHKFNFSAQGVKGEVLIDQKLFRQIVTNLLTNAVKYSPEGSTIRVRLTREPDESILEVEDEGIGIPEEDRTQLFEAFHRARNVEHIAGTGLGLAIVKQAVDLHNGEVSVVSEMGKGTRFTVILPALVVKEQLS